MNKLFAMIAITAGLVAAASSANAKDCWISSRTHEKVCMATSDGASAPYSDARPSKPKAVQAMEIAHARQKRAEARKRLGPWR